MHLVMRPISGCGCKPSDAPPPPYHAGEAAVNVSGDGKEVDFKKVSEEEALSILKVRRRLPGATAAWSWPRRW